MQLRQSKGRKPEAIIIALLVHICLLYFVFGMPDNPLRKLGLLPPKDDQEMERLVSTSLGQQAGAPVFFVADSGSEPEQLQQQPDDQPQEAETPTTEQPLPSPEKDPHTDKDEKLLEEPDAHHEEAALDKTLPEADKEQQPSELEPTQTQLAELSLPIAGAPRPKLQPPTKPEKQEEMPAPPPAPPKPPKPQRAITLADIARDFLAATKEEQGSDVATKGTGSGHPSEDQIRYTRYLKKILICLRDAYQSIKRYEPRGTLPREMLVRVAIDHDGKLSSIELTQSSGALDADAFVQRVFKEASSAFPPTPTTMAQRKTHERIQFSVQDTRQFAMVDGWQLTQ